MDAYRLDIESFARLLRKHAAAHQTGISLREAKSLVEGTICDFKNALGGDRVINVEMWSALLATIEAFNSKTADPAWRTIMNHAKLRIKSKRGALIHGRKRFKAI